MKRGSSEENEYLTSSMACSVDLLERFDIGRSKLDTLVNSVNQK